MVAVFPHSSEPDIYVYSSVSEKNVATYGSHGKTLLCIFQKDPELSLLLPG